MRLYTITLITFLLFSCKNNNTANRNIGKVSKVQNSLILNDIKTPNGNIIKFKTIGEQSWLEWYREDKIETLDNSFDLNGAEA